jgi:hypothetical protein
MSSPNKQDITPFQKPLEIKLADVLFFAMRKNLMLFKDLGRKYVHYSIFIRGSLIDFHQTFEDQHRHIALAEIEFDWQFLLNRVIENIKADWRSIFQIVKIGDPEWEDLEIEFLPVQVLMELLSPMMKGARWNVDVKSLEKLESSLSYSRLRDLADCGMIIGSGSGYLVLANGTDCFLFDTDKMSKIIEKSFELSIRKIYLKHYTLGSTLWYVKIRLLNLVHSTIRYLRKSQELAVSEDFSLVIRHLLSLSC